MQANVVNSPSVSREKIEIEGKYALPVSVVKGILENPATSSLIQFLKDLAPDLVFTTSYVRIAQQKTTYNDDMENSLVFRHGLTARQRLHSDINPSVVTGLKGIDIKGEQIKHLILLGNSAGKKTANAPLARLEDEYFRRIEWDRLDPKAQVAIRDDFIRTISELEKEYNLGSLNNIAQKMEKSEWWWLHDVNNKNGFRNLMPYLAQELSKIAKSGDLHPDLALPKLPLPKPPLFQNNSKLELALLREFGRVVLMHLPYPDVHGITPQRRGHDEVGRLFIDLEYRGTKMELAFDLGVSYDKNGKAHGIICEFELECKKDFPNDQDLQSRNGLEELVKGYLCNQHELRALLPSLSKGYINFIGQRAETFEARTTPLVRRRANAAHPVRILNTCTGQCMKDLADFIRTLNQGIAPIQPN